VESLRLTLLTTIAINIHVRTHEAADPELGAVMTMFRRAANLIARTEDALMFNGQPGPNLAPTRAPAIAGVRAAVTGGQFQYGLLGNEDTGLPTFGDPLPPPADGDRPAFEDGYPEDDPVPGQASRVLIPNTKGPGNPLTAQEAGQALVGSINHGISLLEQAGYTGPFACVLGNRLFETAHEPTGSFVMPRDRILPVLMDGPLLRSSLLANEHGILVAYGSGQVEQVLASDICVKLLHVSGEPRYVFRICERVTLRVRDWNAVVNLC
jgi:hypothetical protein